MITFKRCISICVLLVFVILNIHCASQQGALFKKVTNIPEDKCLIYIYRAEDKMNTEFLIKYFDQELCILQNNGYFPYFADNGKVKLTSTVQFKMFATGILDQAIANPSELVFKAETGKTYYIECTANELGGQELSINVVPLKYGQNQIKQCSLMQQFGKSQ